MLTIHLLGGFHLQVESERIPTLIVPRLQSLLAYMVVNCQRPLLRQQLAFLFWPDSTEAQARSNLRHALHDLRRALPVPEHYLDIQTQWVQWRPASEFTLDLHAFETAHAQAEQLLQAQSIGAALEMYARCAELYRGPFLPSSYAEWVLEKRAEVADRYARTLERLMSLLESRQEYAAAIGYAQRLLLHDPLAEPAYQYLMRLHALAGNRAGALRVYHQCVATLERELGVEPSAETRAAYSHLFRLFRAEPRASISPATFSPQPASSGYETPALIGREMEWQQLLKLWQRASQGNAQVGALGGEAGIGKSRLAETLVNWVSRQGMRVASASAHLVEGGLTYAPVIDMLRSEHLAAKLGDLADIWLEQIARLLPEVRQQYPHLARSEQSPNAAALWRKRSLQATNAGRWRSNWAIQNYSCKPIMPYGRPIPIVRPVPVACSLS